MDNSSKPVQFECNVCNKQFLQKRDLTTHSKLHIAGHMPKRPCPRCGMLFAFDSGNFWRHKRQCTGARGKYRCLLCSSHYNLLARISGHMGSHTVKSSLTCTPCNVSFCQLKMLQDHMKTHIFIAEAEGQQDSDLQKNYSNGLAGIGEESKRGFFSRAYLRGRMKNILGKKRCNRPRFKLTSEKLEDCKNVDILTDHRKQQESGSTTSEMEVAVRDVIGNSRGIMSSVIVKANSATENSEREADATPGGIINTVMKHAVHDQISPLDSVSSTQAGDNYKRLSEKSTEQQNLITHQQQTAAPADDDTCHSPQPSCQSSESQSADLPRAEVRQHKCHICGKQCSSASTLALHLQLHSTKPYHCNICGSLFKDAHKLAVHVRLHAERQIQCKICSKSFASVSSVRFHSATVHFGKKPFRCSVCGARFNSMSILKAHRLKCHSTDVPDVPDGEAPACHICGKRFLHTSSVYHHMQLHRMKPHYCRVCSRFFKSESLLAKHSKLHTETQPKCNICGKSFMHLYSLQKHAVIHSDNKPFCCPSCGARFKMRCNMTRHSRNCHLKYSRKTGGVNFPNAVADTVLYVTEKAASLPSEAEDPSDAVLHTMQPTIENVNNLENSSVRNSTVKFPKSKCGICGKLYCCYYMNDHMNVHLGKKPHQCLMCGQRFAFASSLSTHKRKCLRQKTDLVHGRQCGRHCCRHGTGLTTAQAAPAAAESASEPATGSCEIMSRPEVVSLAVNESFTIVKAESVNSESDADDVEPDVDKKTLPVARLVMYPLKLNEVSHVVFTDACRRANEFGISYVAQSHMPGSLRIGCAFFSFRAAASAREVLQSLKTIRDDLTIRFLEPQENIKKIIESLKSEIIDPAVMSSDPSIGNQATPTSGSLADDMDAMSKAYCEAMQDNAFQRQLAIQEINGSRSKPSNGTDGYRPDSITDSWMNCANALPDNIHPAFYRSALSYRPLPAAMYPGNFMPNPSSYSSAGVNFANQSASAFGQTGHIDPFSTGFLAAARQRWPGGSQSLFSSLSLPGQPVNLPVHRSSNSIDVSLTSGAVRLNCLVSADQKLQMKPVVVIKERVPHNSSSFEENPLSSKSELTTGSKKPHSWKNCDKTTLATSQQLKQREQWPCTICHKSFSTSYYARIHLRYHFQEKPHSCQLCGKAFIFRQHLRVHLKQVHPETV